MSLLALGLFFSSTLLNGRLKEREEEEKDVIYTGRPSGKGKILEIER
jgi:hypothetical protein